MSDSRSKSKPVESSNICMRMGGICLEDIHFFGGEGQGRAGQLFEVMMAGPIELR